MLSTFNPRLETLWRHPFETMDRDFDRFFGGERQGRAVEAPAAPLSLWEDEEHVFVEVDVPGLAKEDLDLTVRDGRLWITGERKFPQGDVKSWYDERRYGRFERVISLSDLVDPDSIEASLENGVLSITLAKKAEARTHRITIKGADGQHQRLSSDKDD